KCLYAATSEDQKLSDDLPDNDRGLSAEETARMQHETESLYREIKLVEESHGENVLNLVPAVGYIRRLLANGRVAKYLQARHSDIHAEFSTMVREPDLTGV